jgi:hypothetical protein
MNYPIQITNIKAQLTNFIFNTFLKYFYRFKQSKILF